MKLRWFDFVTLAIAWTPGLFGVPLWAAWPAAFVFWCVMDARRKYA